MADEKSKRPTTVDECMALLIAPFAPDVVGWKPAGKPHGGTIRAVAYIDARDVQDRLDAVFGADRWYARYVPVGGSDNAQAECRLYVKFPGTEKWIMKCDVGSRSDQPDPEDRLKAMYSDALKRAAVAFGIGRYLYRLDNYQVPYDEQRRQVTSYPDLPDWALPEGYRRAGHGLADQLSKLIDLGCKATGTDRDKAIAKYLADYEYKGNTPLAHTQRRHVRAYMQRVRQVIDNAPLPTDHPKNGPELAARLGSHDGKLASVGRCQVGELVGSVAEQGVKAGYPSDLSQWNQNKQIRDAVSWAIDFDKSHPEKKKPETSPAGKTAAKPETAAV